MIKKSGLINEWLDIQDAGILELIYPSFFIGVELSSDEFPHGPMFLGDPHAEQAVLDKMAKLSLHSGQFVFQHQYGGSSGGQAILLGIVLPLSGCDDNDLRRSIGRAIAQMTRPVGSGAPDAETLDTWASIMRTLGPIRLSDSRASEEALVRLESTDELYKWLKAHFSYITEFSGLGPEEVRRELRAVTGRDVDPTLFWREEGAALSEADKSKVFAIQQRNRSSRAIGKLEPLSWKDVAAFADWLIGEHGPLKHKRKDVECALVWQNSD